MVYKNTSKVSYFVTPNPMLTITTNILANVRFAQDITSAVRTAPVTDTPVEFIL